MRHLVNHQLHIETGAVRRRAEFSPYWRTSDPLCCTSSSGSAAGSINNSHAASICPGTVVRQVQTKRGSRMETLQVSVEVAGRGRGRLVHTMRAAPMVSRTVCNPQELQHLTPFLVCVGPELSPDPAVQVHRLQIQSPSFDRYLTTRCPSAGKCPSSRSLLKHGDVGLDPL